MVYTGGNHVRLLAGGDELFPAMHAAIAAARREVWLVTYIFHHDEAAQAMAQALREAAGRGVRVGVVVDGFGSRGSLAQLQRWWAGSSVSLAVFRPLDRWWAVLQPGQFRRLHHKLCVVDDEVAFVGGINILDDRVDVRHGRADAPRLDYAVRLAGPVVLPVAHTARALWSRAALGHDWRGELAALVGSAEPVKGAGRLMRSLRIAPPVEVLLPGVRDGSPVRAAFVVRDNLRHRGAIEHSQLEAFRHARHSIDLVTPYFYPGQRFRRALRQAARRGVRVRLLLQGKLDYRIAGLAATVLYDELLRQGVEIYEYTPAWLHAKAAVVDGRWVTVGSSNIDPLSLLLNLEANVAVDDAGFADELGQRLAQALAQSRRVDRAGPSRGWWGALRRGVVAWGALIYLRMAGITRPY
ncbi:cardiolipin synthase ClsB [Aquabacterium sp. J223]|uniref:cardiolipin synthase ClsB n=1 Tax=Aquabacterium sp. J223 TaxID=2898431 RepID=UPI0021AD56A8|nr:cardiolipin synthase ClsB [Aquabacterium sp. J223]UUX96866.1 cardiolipin synthase ClsB [Aquabacterium sp. J223]